MSGFKISGPAPQPGVLYRQARERALRELHTRDRQERAHRDYVVHSAANPQPCPFCESGLYAAIPSPCPACGRQANNGHAVLEQRHAQPTPTTKCGICGSTAWPDCCLFGWQTQGQR